MKQSRRQHHPSFQAEVALEALFARLAHWPHRLGVLENAVSCHPRLLFGDTCYEPTRVVDLCYSRMSSAAAWWKMLGVNCPECPTNSRDGAQSCGGTRRPKSG